MESLSLSGEELYELMGSFLQDGIGCSMKIQCMGVSMAPFIRNNGILTLKPLNDNCLLKNGDIVVAAIHTKKRIIIHRIIKALPPQYLIKGDNNRDDDGWFNKKNILAIVEKIENSNGISYRPRQWQNRIIALASRTNILLLRRIIRTA